MWKPASQLQCWARFTWAQRGLRLNAGSFITLHSGGAVLGEKIWKTCRTIWPQAKNILSGRSQFESLTLILWYWPVWVWCWQWEPLQFWGQVHLYWLRPSTQVPPFWQGLLAHSLISVDVGEDYLICSQLACSFFRSLHLFSIWTPCSHLFNIVIHTDQRPNRYYIQLFTTELLSSELHIPEVKMKKKNNSNNIMKRD